ncbi:DNA-directed RNA polymerase III subunit RPC3, partial [Cladochytrium tenue]
MSGKLQALARQVVREHFGDIVETVFAALVRKGRQLFSGILAATRLQPKQVRECLFILVQHGAARHIETTEGHRQMVYYSVDYSGVLLRDRVPLFARLALERFGQTGAEIVLHMSTHGRVFPKHIFSAIEASDLLDVWRGLVEHNLVEKVTDDEGSAAAASADVPEITAAPAKGRRGAAARANAEFASNGSAGSKRKLASTGDEHSSSKASRMSRLASMALGETSPEDDVCISELAWRRINENAGEVMRALLELTESMGPMSKIGSTSASVPAISSKLREDKITETVTSSWLSGMLQLMEQNEVPFVTRADERGGGLYAVNFEKITAYLKQELIENHVREKFGIIGLRIWRLLLYKGMLGEKEDVPKTLDHAPSRTFFLFSVSVPRCASALQDAVCEAALRLKLRAAHHTAAVAGILDKLQRSDVQENRDLLPDGERRAVDAYLEARDRLRVSELRI